jgi:predicted DNA-binding transcriptional regulator AlpA
MAEDTGVLSNDEIKIVNGHQLFTTKQLCNYLEISRSTLYNIRNRNRGFPDPVTVGVSERMYWKRADIDSWVSARNKGV